MHKEDWKKIQNKKAKAVAMNIKLSPPALHLLEQNVVSEMYILALIDHHLWADALLFLANAIPLREGIWWACLAARDVLNPAKTSDRHLLAIETAEQWVYNPNTQNGIQAMKLARTFKAPTQALVILLAIGLNGARFETSPNSPNMTIVCSSLITGSITISALQGKTKEQDERYNYYLSQGIDIAKGGNGKINRS